MPRQWAHSNIAANCTFPLFCNNPEKEMRCFLSWVVSMACVFMSDWNNRSRPKRIMKKRGFVFRITLVVYALQQHHFGYLSSQFLKRKIAIVRWIAKWRKKRRNKKKVSGYTPMVGNASKYFSNEMKIVHFYWILVKKKERRKSCISLNPSELFPKKEKGVYIYYCTIRTKRSINLPTTWT